MTSSGPQGQSCPLPGERPGAVRQSERGERRGLVVGGALVLLAGLLVGFFWWGYGLGEYNIFQYQQEYHWVAPKTFFLTVGPARMLFELKLWLYLVASLAFLAGDWVIVGALSSQLSRTPLSRALPTVARNFAPFLGLLWFLYLVLRTQEPNLAPLFIFIFALAWHLGLQSLAIAAAWRQHHEGSTKALQDAGGVRAVAGARLARHRPMSGGEPKRFPGTVKNDQVQRRDAETQRTREASGEGTAGRRGWQWGVTVAVAVVAAGTFALFSWLALRGYAALHVGYGDSGMFATILYNTLHGRPFFADTVTITSEAAAKNYLGWHFSPGLLLLVPIFWLFPRHETLLVLHALFLSLAAFPVYLATRRLSGSALLGGALACGYLVAAPLSHANWGNTYGFQPYSLVVPVVAWTLWAVVAERWRSLALCVAVGLVLEEQYALILVGLGAWLVVRSLVARPRRRRTPEASEPLRVPASPMRAGSQEGSPVRPKGITPQRACLQVAGGSASPGLRAVGSGLANEVPTPRPADFPKSWSLRASVGGWRWLLGVGLGLVGLLWFSCAVYWWMPWFGAARVSARYHAYLGATPGAMLLALPGALLRTLADWNRWEYIIHLMLPVGGLAVLAPEVLLVAGPLFLGIILADNPAKYSLILGHQGPLLPVVALAAAAGARRVMEHPWLRKLVSLGGEPGSRSEPFPAALAVFVLAGSLASGYFFAVSPLSRSYARATFQLRCRDRLVTELEARIPQEASVCATFRVASHFAIREHLYLFPVDFDAARYPQNLGDPDFIILDFAENWTHPGAVVRGRDALWQDPQRRLLYGEEGFLLYVRGANNGSEVLSGISAPNARPRQPLNQDCGFGVTLVGTDSAVTPAEPNLLRVTWYWLPGEPLAKQLFVRVAVRQGEGQAKRFNLMFLNGRVPPGALPAGVVVTQTNTLELSHDVTRVPVTVEVLGLAPVPGAGVADEGAGP